jgi:hypothetical protein
MRLRRVSSVAERDKTTRTGRAPIANATAPPSAGRNHARGAEVDLHGEGRHEPGARVVRADRAHDHQPAGLTSCAGDKR